MRKITFLWIVLLVAISTYGQQQVKVVSDESGCRMEVDGKPFFVVGMNWDYFPIGTNYVYSLWNQPEDVIQEALDKEMPLLKQMGVNAIRQYASIPPQWIQYIYEKYGIYTMINHSFGRYGVMVNGRDYHHTDYTKDEVCEYLLREMEDFANNYRNTPGLLMYLLGNENNYGLFWAGAETESIPAADSLNNQQARCMYSLMNEAAIKIKEIDPSRPVAICNGDLMFIDIIAEMCSDVDILGVNSYRGKSFDKLFSDVKEKYGRPVLFTEFGSDAFNAVTQQEAQEEQADILLSNWKEIYLNAAGMGQAGNCIGGFTFQFSDGWWKYEQKTNLDVHDTHASWANGGYEFDYVEGKNNMNEEWFGICGKGQPDSRGIYELYPRKAYEVLQAVHRFQPYASSMSSLHEIIDNHTK